MLRRSTGDAERDNRAELVRSWCLGNYGSWEVRRRLDCKPRFEPPIEELTGYKEPCASLVHGCVIDRVKSAIRMPVLRGFFIEGSFYKKVTYCGIRHLSGKSFNNTAIVSVGTKITKRSYTEVLVCSSTPQSPYLFPLVLLLRRRPSMLFISTGGLRK